MNPSPIRPAVWALVALPLLLAGAWASAAPAGVRDNAGFFSEPAKSAAARTISEIEKTLQKDVLIETFREIPAAEREGIDLRDKAAVARAFESWSARRARELGLNGIYVLMTREPAHLQVAVGNQTQREAFTLADRNTLVDRMLERLRAKKNDEALTAGVGFVYDTLRAHSASVPGVRTPANPRTTVASPAVPTRNPAAEETPRPRGLSIFSLVLPILVIGVVVMVVMRLIGGLLGRNSFGGTPPVLGGGGGGGGGFMRSMLGGLFGAAAGMWLYDRFTGHGGNAWGADVPPDTGGGGDDPFSRRDTDFSSSGGDFGGSTGGGDFGGGFGGGDSGGAGGDFGGGGGGGGGDF